MRHRIHKRSVAVYPTDTDAAKALLFEADVLRKDRDGNITNGTGNVREAYALGVIAIFEGRLKITKWHSERRQFAAMIAEIHGELSSTD